MWSWESLFCISTEDNFSISVNNETQNSRQDRQQALHSIYNPEIQERYKMSHVYAELFKIIIYISQACTHSNAECYNYVFTGSILIPFVQKYYISPLLLNPFQWKKMCHFKFWKRLAGPIFLTENDLSKRSGGASYYIQECIQWHHTKQQRNATVKIPWNKIINGSKMHKHSLHFFVVNVVWHLEI